MIFETREEAVAALWDIWQTIDRLKSGEPANYNERKSWADKALPHVEAMLKGCGCTVVHGFLIGPGQRFNADTCQVEPIPPCEKCNGAGWIRPERQQPHPCAACFNEDYLGGTGLQGGALPADYFAHVRSGDKPYGLKELSK